MTATHSSATQSLRPPVLFRRGWGERRWVVSQAGMAVRWLKQNHPNSGFFSDFRRSSPYPPMPLPASTGITETEKAYRKESKKTWQRTGRFRRFQKESTLMNHRITESFRSEKTLKSLSPTASITLTSPLLNHVSKHHVCTSLKYLQGWGLHYFTGQPGPMLGNPFG